MVNFLIAAALAAASPQAPPPVPAVEATEIRPAMFAVRDADTIVFIFGTFHALDGHTDWLNGNVLGAFERSDELVLETLVPEGPDRGQLSSMPRYRGLMTPSASFLATTRMAIDAGRSQGMQVGNGADMILRHVAEAEGKPVEGLETLESQLAMFTKLPAPPRHEPKPGEPIPETTPMDSLSKAMAEMQTAWKHGDQSVFVRMLGQLSQNSPDTYRMMFTERNGRWADWIRARLQTPGTVFVAVGAGHLAGKDSLLVQLAERGIPSQRVN
jgi:uncharacterized protein YbaP (TraB family)